jgi:hypothetical protein
MALIQSNRGYHTVIEVLLYKDLKRKAKPITANPKANIADKLKRWSPNQSK